MQERSKEKWGKYTVGTKIKIILKKRQENLNQTIFVTPWGFIKEFIKREND